MIQSFCVNRDLITLDWSSDNRREPHRDQRDELDLADIYSAGPQFSEGFIGIRSAMIETWHDLRGEAKAPFFAGLGDLPEDYRSPEAFGFSFSSSDSIPEILFLGARTAAEAAWVRGRSSPGLAFLRAIHDQAISNGLPLDFSDELILAEDEVFACRGVAFPFASDGQDVDAVFVRFDLDDQGVIAPAIDDVAEESELLLEQEFEARDAQAEKGKPLPTPFFVISTRKNPDEPIQPAPEQASSTDVVVPQRLTIMGHASNAPALDAQLRTARELAAKAFASEERSHLALYQAIGAAYDLALAKRDAPEAFADLLTQEGIKVQERAEMTPIVKLVFGKDYDKTRVTEYAAALMHASRAGLERGELPGLLYNNDGGLKGIVQDERALRRQELGRLPAPRHGVRHSTAKKLRNLPSYGLDDIASAGEEFALVMIRRGEDGQVAMLGEVPEDRAMLERASRKLIEARKSASAE